MTPQELDTQAEELLGYCRAWKRGKLTEQELRESIELALRMVEAETKVATLRETIADMETK